MKKVLREIFRAVVVTAFVVFGFVVAVPAIVAFTGPSSDASARGLGMALAVTALLSFGLAGYVNALLKPEGSSRVAKRFKKREHPEEAIQPIESNEPSPADHFVTPMLESEDWVRRAPLELAELVLMAREHYLKGDYFGASTWYQKCAYYSPRLKDEELKWALKKELTGFAMHNPNFIGIWKDVRKVIAENPGILQTELYKMVPYDREQVRYVTYFAEESGLLKRERSGRTYSLRLADG